MEAKKRGLKFGPVQVVRAGSGHEYAKGTFRLYGERRDLNEGRVSSCGIHTRCAPLLFRLVSLGFLFRGGLRLEMKINLLFAQPSQNLRMNHRFLFRVRNESLTGGISQHASCRKASSLPCVRPWVCSTFPHPCSFRSGPVPTKLSVRQNQARRVYRIRQRALHP